MKKLLLTITSIVVTLLTMAQSPNLMNYQGVARNAVGNVIPSQQIGVRLSILTGTPSGAVVYMEQRNVFTNAFGLFTVVLGSPGVLAQTGTIAGVNWTAFGAGSGNKYLQVELDPTGGSNFINVGVTQMVSVPYALNAGGAAPIGPAGGDLTGTYPNPQILIPLIKTQSVPGSPMISMTNTSTTGIFGALFGSSASTDANAVGVQGTLTAAGGGSFSSAVRGNSNSTTGSGIGVWGSQNGSGYGVYGTTPTGWSVIGETNSGYGVWGTAATSGVGVYGRSATGNSALFQNLTAGNTNATVAVTTNGTGDGINVVNTGTGRAGWFQVNNPASTANAIETSTNGVSPSWAIRATSTGTQGAGLFIINNALTNPGNAVQSTTNGLGRAGFFTSTNTAGTLATLEASNSTLNGNVSAITGNMLTTTGSANSTGLRGNNNSNTDFGIGVWGGHNGSGWGVYGYATGNGGANWGAGVYADLLSGGLAGGSAVRGNNYNAGGFAGYFLDNNGGATSRALRTAGKVQMTGINEANNWILKSDAVGNATWANPAVLLAPLFWATTGNAGTVDGTNFIGTTDNVPFNVRVNNNVSGRIDPALINTSWGYQSFFSAPTGNFNTGIGHQSLVFLTSGVSNTALGGVNLPLTTTGSNNTGVGVNNLFTNTSGSGNTAVGFLNNRSNTTGSNNSSLGFQSLFFNTTGNFNTAVSYQANANNTTGIQNTAVGAQALFSSTTGANNTAIGTLALTNNTTGSGNTALGVGANVASGALVNATAIGFTASVSASNSLVLGNNANVGIGISAPVNKLDVTNANNTNAGNFVNTNAGNTVATLRTISASTNFSAPGLNAISVSPSSYGGGVAGVYGNSFNFQGVLGASDNNYGVQGASNFSHGVLGQTYAGASTVGVFGIGNGGNYGIAGIANAGGIGGYFSGSVRALWTQNGGLQFQNINEAAGRVLTSDAFGNATWQDNNSQNVGITLQNMNNTPVNIANGATTTIVDWANIISEEGGPGNYNGATGEYTVTKAGVYNVEAHIFWNAFTANSSANYMSILLNGGTTIAQSGNTAVAGDFLSNAVNISRRFNVNDRIKIAVQQFSGATQSIGAYNGNHFSVQFLHK